jgi:alginate lyase
MSIQTEHIGLYFGQTQIKNVKEQYQDYQDLAIAWQWLLAKSDEVVGEITPQNEYERHRQVIKPQLDKSSQMIEAGFRYRFFDDKAAAQKAISELQTGIDLSEQSSLLKTIQTTLSAAHCFEMIREISDDSAQWLTDFAIFTDKLNQSSGDATFIEQLWLMTLNIVSGVLLEDDARFDAGVIAYRQAIDEHIHPDGYIKPIVKDEEDAVKAYREMTLACAALVLATEAASQAGHDLWSYKSRDVSINTAATYLVYYYFYPNKWRWGEGLTEHDTEAIFRDYGAWMDIMTYHVTPRGVELLLSQQRPFFNSYMGGLTTLSHFKTKRHKRWGLFG